LYAREIIFYKLEIIILVYYVLFFIPNLLHSAQYKINTWFNDFWVQEESNVYSNDVVIDDLGEYKNTCFFLLFRYFFFLKNLLSLFYKEKGILTLNLLFSIMPTFYLFISSFFFPSIWMGCYHVRKFLQFLVIFFFTFYYSIWRSVINAQILLMF